MKFSIPHKSLIINLSILLVITGQVVFIIPPSLKIVPTIQTAIQRQFDEVNRQLTLGQTTKKVGEELEKIKPFLETLATVFLQKEDQLNFITTLEEAAIKHNIEAKIILPDIPTSETSKEVFQVPLSLVISGNYVDTVKFLIELQNLQYYVNIIDLSMNSQNSDFGNSVINTNLRANTYWRNK